MRFVILGLVGIGFVRSSGGGVDFLGDDHSRLSQACQAELQKIHLHWKWMVAGFAGWTSTGNVELEMENKARTLGLLDAYFEESRESFERKFPAATDGGVERRAFDSEIENAKMELNEVWDERIKSTNIKTKRFKLSRAIEMYTPITVANALNEELEGLRESYPVDFSNWFEKFDYTCEKYMELKRRAGLIDDGDSVGERMEKTLMSALNSRKEKYLRSIGNSENIEELVKVKMDMDNKLKEEIVTKYNEDVANTVGLVDARRGYEVYQEFFDSKIKPTYDNKMLQLITASSVAAKVVAPHHF